VGRADDAVREVERAIDDAPGMAVLYRWLALHYIEVGQYPRATWWLRAMTGAVAPGTPEAREVVRWIEMAYADMRRRGVEPPDAASLPAEEPGRQ
jgi:hypothetical protein